jgi:TolB-like protein/DNA-binding winged helix-turn-helix (wHTH) protein/tetratricopeptide (TPR) repeat protein
MPDNPQAAYEFGQFTLFPAEKRLLCDGKAVALAPKVFDTLVLLVENQGRLIQKEVLLQTLWPDSFVEEVALAHNISQLRKALGDTTEQPRFIETVPKRGYRFIAAVQQMEKLAVHVAAPARDRILPSMIQNFRSLRPAVWAAFAAMLVLVVSAAAYVYLGRIGRTASGASPPIHSLAVLPLENLSGDKEQEYFADGMTDELITELGKIGALRVISRTSVMQYKATRKPLNDIAGKLNVDAVVEGTVLRSGNRVRITAQLVRAATEKHLWAESYEGDLNDVLALQRNVARDVAREIRIKLTPQEERILAGARPVNPQAQVAYLKGLFFLNKRLPVALDKSAEFFDQAIELDPTYAQAYAGRSITYIYVGIVGLVPPREAFPKAKTAAMKALELDETLADAYAALGQVSKQYDWDWAKAETMYKRALELTPSSWVARGWYAGLLSTIGRFEQSIKLDMEARDLDPISANSGTFLGRDLYRARRYDEAIRACQEALELEPDHLFALRFQAQSLEQKHQFSEAIAKLERAVSLSDGPIYRGQLAHAYALAGNQAKALDILEQLKALSKEKYVVPVDIAIIYTGLGDRNSAFQWLEKAYQERTARITELSEPHFDSLRSDPRFPDLMRRIGLPQ